MGRVGKISVTSLKVPVIRSESFASINEPDRAGIIFLRRIFVFLCERVCCVSLISAQ